MTTDGMPDSLRQAIAADLAPVKPLPPAWRRTLVVAAVAIAVFGVMVTGFRLRPDLAAMPMWLGWGCSVLQLGVG